MQAVFKGNYLIKTWLRMTFCPIFVFASDRWDCYISFAILWNSVFLCRGSNQIP